MLDLRVFNEPQFSGPLLVTDEGFVEVPFVGVIPARCRTDVEVRKDISTALAKYLRSPQVSLYLKEAKSRPAAVVFGAVRQATRVEMKRRVHLLDILAVAGGVTEQAGGDIQIFHTEPVMCPERETDLAAAAAAEKKAIEERPDATSVTGAFSIYKLTDLKVGKAEANPFIRPGDIVIVTEAPPIYLTGAVTNPQGIYLREKMQLTRAIAMVGGTRKEAKTSAIRIFRLKPNSQEQEVLTVNFDAIKKQKQPDIFLQPYDVIEVPDPSGIFYDIKRAVLSQGIQGLGSAATGLPLRVLY
jgi:polysaccharide export outer membrane protein